MAQHQHNIIAVAEGIKQNNDIFEYYIILAGKRIGWRNEQPHPVAEKFDVINNIHQYTCHRIICTYI